MDGGASERLLASRFVKLSSRTSGKLSRGGGEQPKMELRSTAGTATPLKMARSSRATPLQSTIQSPASLLVLEVVVELRQHKEW